jgi:hypothetical protein
LALGFIDSTIARAKACLEQGLKPSSNVGARRRTPASGCRHSGHVILPSQSIELALESRPAWAAIMGLGVG